MKRFTQNIIFGLTAFLMIAGLTVGLNFKSAGAKTVSATLEKDNVSVGRHINIQAKTIGVKYSSSDSQIACVNEDGRITGKNAGTVSIRVKKSGYTARVFKVTVKKADTQPKLPVALDEIKIVSQNMRGVGSTGNKTYALRIKNTADKGNIRKLIYHYKIIYRTDKASAATGAAVSKPALENKTVEMTFKNVAAGKSAKSTCMGDYSGKVSAMELTRVELYTGDALYTYDYSSKKASLKWGTPDTKGPVFSGWIGKKSCNGSDAYQVCYSDKKKTYNLKKYISVKDDRGGKVKVKVDTSKVNWKKDGKYKVWYTGTDESGNVTKAWARIQVYVYSSYESVADMVLDSLIKDSWSNERKARAIYHYVKTNCSFTHSGSHTNWRSVAVNGLRYKSGDCFTYYAMSRLLLTRAGLPNIMVRRYPSHAGYNHWWNLVYVNGQWYHLDACPRSSGGEFCLLTDSQIRGYDNYGSTYSFKEEEYPKRASKEISPAPVRTR